MDVSFSLTYLAYFSSTLAMYWLLNRPFMGLKCHHDAGWMSYWAAFRHKGEPLATQHNVLAGCARIANMYLYVVLFKLFGVQDPELLSRKVFLFLNWCASVILFFAVRTMTPQAPSLAFIIPVVYLAAFSNPFWGVHYDTAERTVAFVSAILLWLAGIILASPDSYLLALAVFVMFSSALFFKASQLSEYLFVWLFILWAHGKPADIPASFVGALAGFLAYCLFLRWKGLWRRENFRGLLGYALSTRRSQGSSPFARWAGAFETCRIYGKPIVESSRWLLILVFLSLLLPPGIGKLEVLGALWLLGALLGFVVQGKYFHLHFIPFLLPLSLLAGVGLYKLLQLDLGSPLWWVATAALLAAVLLDAKKLLSLLPRPDGLPMDYRVWPGAVRDWIERNLAAYEIARYVKEHSSEDDYIFVWGIVPQTYVLAGRRSPVGWLNTAGSLMGPILPMWKELTLANLLTTRPLFLVVFDSSLDLAELRRATGLEYAHERSFFSGQYAVYRLHQEDVAGIHPDRPKDKYKGAHSGQALREPAGA